MTDKKRYKVTATTSEWLEQQVDEAILVEIQSTYMYDVDAINEGCAIGIAMNALTERIEQTARKILCVECELYSSEV